MPGCFLGQKSLLWPLCHGKKISPVGGRAQEHDYFMNGVDDMARSPSLSVVSIVCTPLGSSEFKGGSTAVILRYTAYS